MWLFVISRRGFFAESRMKPLLDEVNSIIRILGKSVSTTRSRLNEQKEDAHPEISGQ